MNDDQNEAKVTNDVMGEDRSTNEMAWKPLETRPHNYVSGARGDSGADASRRQCRHGWTQTKNSQGRDPRTQQK